MRALAHVIPAAIRELLRGMPLSDGKVGFAWSTAVGPAFGRATAVRLEGRVLIVETSSVYRCSLAGIPSRGSKFA
jgi:hypothetical protein